MGLKLNKISDENARDEIKDNLEFIPRRLAKLEECETSSEKEKHLEKLATLNFETGGLLYQLEAPKEEIVFHLKSAAEYYARLFWTQTGLEEGGARFVGDFEMTIDLVVCFAEKDRRKSLAGIQRWQYDCSADDEYRTRVDFLDVEKVFVGNGVLVEDEIQRLETFCSSDKASKEERNFLLPKIKGINAIASGDQASFHGAITDLVEAHKWEALRGEYRLMYEGLICLPGMMLAQLGREKKMAVTVQSDYLPLHLLE